MKKKIAIQGLRGSFHHEAANHFFEEDVELIECEAFADVTKAVTSKIADRGVLAIENSLAGSIIPNYALVRKEAVEVVGEVGIRVKMNLMALPGTQIQDISEAQSHQMALRQCEGFFDEYPNIRRVEAFDTAGSAQIIKDQGLVNVAAIGSEVAAKEYGLEIIKKGIEDHDLNYTRFLILQAKGANAVENPNKVSIYFQTKNSPGALSQALTIISGLGINLGKLQSHPVPSKNSLYGFYATLEIEETEQLEHLKIIMTRMALTFEILGIYRKGQTHG